MKKILLIALTLTAAIFTSCKSNDNTMDNAVSSAACKEFLAGGSEAALYSAGKYSLVNFEEEQIAYSEDRSIYMVSNMESTKNYTLDIEGALRYEATVKVFYTSEGYEGTLAESGELSMIVANVDAAQEKVWLWNEKSKLGFILHFEPIEE